MLIISFLRGKRKSCSIISAPCILEFNACWGAGLNNCKAEKVIECIIGATINTI
jgi:hypothetical protein